MRLKLTPEQWIEVIRYVASFLIGLITALFLDSCTASMSISKYNSNSTQSTEQTSTSSVDSTKINIHR